MEEKQTQIGQEGDSMNFSYATRAMNTEPDSDQLEKYDEYPTGGNPIMYVFILLTIALLGFTIYLFTTGHWVWGIVGILVSLILAFLSYMFGNASLKKSVAYENGLLIPAIIVNTNPIQILAIADMSADEAVDPVYGVKKMTVNNLPNHVVEKGEKVPCVALFGMAYKGYRRMFEPRPVSWGYKNKDVIQEAIQAISQDDVEGKFENEWEMLYEIETKYSDKIKDDELTFFDKDLEQLDM